MKGVHSLKREWRKENGASGDVREEKYDLKSGLREVIKGCRRYGRPRRKRVQMKC